MCVVDYSSDSAFSAACASLNAIVAADFRPDVVVGIAAGGERVAEEMCFPSGFQRLTVRRQRRTTAMKSTLGLPSILSMLPTPLNDLLRRIELAGREAIFGLLRRHPESAEVTLISGDITAIQNCPVRVLVVDDAVDSGGTLIDVLRFLRSHNAVAEVRSAVIVTTFDNALVNPDFVLLQRAIVRFPWSADARRER